MKTTRRLISLLLVLFTVLPIIAGCGGSDDTDASHNHTFDAWSYDASTHRQICSNPACGEEKSAEPHNFSDGSVTIEGNEIIYAETCSVCSYAKTEKGATNVTLTFDDLVNAIYDGAISMAHVDIAFTSDKQTHYFQRLVNQGKNTVKVKASADTTVSFIITSLAGNNKNTCQKIFPKLTVNGSSDGVSYTNETPNYQGWEVAVDARVATLTLKKGLNEISFEIGTDTNIAGFKFKDHTAPIFVTNTLNVKPEATLRGEGSEASPWLIEKAEDFITMNAWMTYDAAYAKGHYKMTADIDFKDVTFSGINATVGFSGTFDGDGHVVQNLNIARKMQNNTALFGKVIGGTVKNLGIASGMVEGNYSVGGIIGYAKNATVLNCFNEATVKGHNEVGGIVGTGATTTVANAFNKGDVRLSGRESVGGIFGTATGCTINNAYNLGFVPVGTYTGQLIGAVTGVIKATVAYYDKNAGINNQPIGTMQKPANIKGLTKEELCSEGFVNTLNQSLKDGYMPWIFGEDKVARLSKFEENAKISVFEASIDKVTVKNKEIETIFSKDGAYKTVVAGSDKRSVISLDGKVYEPLTDQKVLLILDIVEVATGKVVGRVDRNIEITVEGRYSTSGTNKVPNVVPGLREWYGLSGNFTVTNNTRIVSTEASLKALAERTATYMQDMIGITLKTAEGDSKAGDIVLKLDPDKAGEFDKEGYAIDIDEQVVIEAATETGLFYGAVSIMQILYQDATRTNIPKGYIRDYPAYEMRGGMLDVARKYFSIDYVEELGKYMSWFKLNTLSLHINDNNGEYTSSFVVESKKYPKLNQYNGKYVWSQEEYKALQDNLKSFGVNVITEIDSPGHAKVFGLIDPTLVQGTSLKLNTKYDESLALIKSIYDEFLDGDDPVFRSATVHIGTDEASNASKEDMRRFISDLSQYVLAKDNVEKVIFWGNLSLYYGQTEIDPENVITQIWDSPDLRADEALAQGFEVINSVSDIFYLVPNYSTTLGDFGKFNGYIEIAKLYDIWKGASDFTTSNAKNPAQYNPNNGYYYAEHDFLKGNPQILGALFCNWNDNGIGYDYDIGKLLLAYIGGTAEKCWYGDTDRFEKGEDFAKAFNKVGSFAPYANPLYNVESEGTIIASYDFEETISGMIKDKANGYHARAVNGTVTTVNGSNVLALNGSTSLQLPFDGVGYPYTASFRLYLDGKQDENAILFTCDDCTIHLNYNGKSVAFESGKYVYGFDVTIPTGEWVEITITSQSPTVVHGQTNITVLTVNGKEYLPSNITNTRSQSRSTVLGTKDTFLGIKGYLDDLIISNQFRFDPLLETFKFEGEGTESAPYLIKTANDLTMFSRLLNMGKYTSAHFKLTADIDMTNIAYASASEFKGTLDGDGHKITGLTISETAGERVGLVGFLNGGTIKNLGIENSTIKGKKWVGALVGRTMNAVITNCYSKATVIGTDDVGGLVGMLNSTQLSNCYSMATVSGTTSVGGIAGSANTSLNRNNPAAFDNIYTMATVSGKSYVGSIVGYDEGAKPEPVTMTNLYAFGDTSVTGNNPSRQFTKLSEAELTNGTLLAALNSNLKEGYQTWVAGSDGYPTLSK